VVANHIQWVLKLIIFKAQSAHKVDCMCRQVEFSWTSAYHLHPCQTTTESEIRQVIWLEPRFKCRRGYRQVRTLTTTHAQSFTSARFINSANDWAIAQIYAVYVIWIKECHIYCTICYIQWIFCTPGTFGLLCTYLMPRTTVMSLSILWQPSRQI
jgi:hypothetical protein